MFDGQALHYIAWKREWRAHHQENYPGLQEDALKRVLGDIALGMVARSGSGTRQMWTRCGTPWIGRSTCGRTPSCMT